MECLQEAYQWRNEGRFSGPRKHRLRVNRPRQAGASEVAHSSVVFEQISSAASRGKRHSSVTPEDQKCRTLCWIRYRRQRSPATDPHTREFDPPSAAATFLKHKLWRIRNTAKSGPPAALRPASQVFDRSALCSPDDRLARLLLVDTRIA